MALALALVSVCAPLSVARAANALDSLSRSLPGTLAGSSLSRALRTPTAGQRWEGLAPFGRDMFDADHALAPVEGGPIGPDYVLGPGDQLQVFISTFADTSYTLTLDREGKAFVPRVGSTFLWGMSFAEAERLVRGRIESVFRNARVQISMGRVRALEVYVLGNVQRPGKVTLSGAATSFHALAAAGGPNSLGGIRELRVVRGMHELTRPDLYPFLLEGDRSRDVRLENGDVLFVPVAGGRVGVRGEVARPAVYEMRGPLTLRALLALAGGPTSFADLARVRIERVLANGGFRMEDVLLQGPRGADPDTLQLHDQDLVTVLPLAERVQNMVTLDGFVRHPGDYELRTAMKLSDLLSRDRVLPEADLDHAEFRRIDPHTLTATVTAFSVRKLWDGEGDLELRPLDAVTVFSSARMPASVAVAGEVLRPGRYSIAPGERLSSVLARAGGLTPRGSLRAAVFRRPGSATNSHAMRHELQERRRVELDRQAIAAAGDTAAMRALAVQRALFQSMEDDADLDRIVLSIDERKRWAGTVADVVLEDGDLFTVPVLPSTVTVLGSVMNPGTLTARKGASALDYVKLAGGFARDAERSLSYVLRANGEAVPLARASRVEAGDAVVVSPKPVDGHNAGRSLAILSQWMLQVATAAAVVFAAVK